MMDDQTVSQVLLESCKQLEEGQKGYEQELIDLTNAARNEIQQAKDDTANAERRYTEMCSR